MNFWQCKRSNAGLNASHLFAMTVFSKSIICLTLPNFLVEKLLQMNLLLGKSIGRDIFVLRGYHACIRKYLGKSQGQVKIAWDIVCKSK